MHRWGAWGHYEGQCTASDCVYTITLRDSGSQVLDSVRWDSWRGAIVHRIFSPYSSLGGHYASERVSFLVQDGTVWRSSIGLVIAVEPHALKKDDDSGYELMVSARASDALRRRHLHDHWILGSEEQLADHPDYKEGRPGGCETCMSAEVTFTPYLPQAELRRLTSYDLSCLTRFNPCLTLPDVLPAARTWHLYPSVEGGSEDTPEAEVYKPCTVPIFALGRDASNVLAVEVLTTHFQLQSVPEGHTLTIERARIGLQSRLKGTANLPASPFDVVPFSASLDEPGEKGEALEAGKRYIILPDSYEEDGAFTPNLPHCGVFPDTPDIRSQLERGFAEEDKLRHRDSFGHESW